MKCGLNLLSVWCWLVDMWLVCVMKLWIWWWCSGLILLVFLVVWLVLLGMVLLCGGRLVLFGLLCIIGIEKGLVWVRVLGVWEVLVWYKKVVFDEVVGMWLWNVVMGVVICC